MNIVEIDIRDLPCPQPVVKVKKALSDVTNETLKHASYQILGNTLTAKENVCRYLKTAGFDFDIGHSKGEQYIIALKGRGSKEAAKKSDKITQKILLVKSDKIGDGELGVMLINAFMKTLQNTDVLPHKIIFINRGVLLTTNNSEVQNDEIVEILKELEGLGVQIYSCGSCLSYYALTERLKVGIIGNALESMESMLHSDGIITFG